MTKSKKRTRKTTQKNPIEEDQLVEKTTRRSQRSKKKVRQLHEEGDEFPIEDVAVAPEDSVSQTGRKSVLSASSSVAARRLQLASDKALLEAHAAAEEEKRRIELDELLLKQRKEALETKLKLASIESEEIALRSIAALSVGAEQGSKGNQMSPKKSTTDVNKKNGFSVVQPALPSNGQVRQNMPNTGIQNTNLNVQAAEFVPLQLDYNHNASDSINSTNLTQLILAGQGQQRQLIDAIRLPTTQLPSFDGDPLKYWSFIRTFDNIMETGNIESSAKLVRLIQACTGKAKKVIECCLVMNADEGYKRARELLRERFGDEYMISNSWIAKITQFKVIRPNERERLQEFADELKNCQETLRCMGYLEEANNQTVLVKVLEQLPNYLQQRFKKDAQQIRERERRSPRFSDIVTFVRQAAAESNDPVFGSLASHPMRETYSMNKTRNATSAAILSNVQPRDSVSSATADRVKRQPAKCLVCDNEHSLFSCRQFKELSVDERIDIAKRHRLCFNCLVPNHTSERCRIDRTCSVPGCGRKHTKFLHKVSLPTKPSRALNHEESLEASQHNTVLKQPISEASMARVGTFTGVGSIKTALPILPVVIHNPLNGQSVRTLALLDTGSTNTFCTNSLVQELSLQGKEETLVLSTLEKANSRIKAMVVSFQVSGKDGEHTVDIRRAYVTETLPISTDNLGTSVDVSRWRHLAFLELPDVHEGRVELLIGQDAPDALIPREVLSSSEDAPYAVRTVLGWTLNGPLSPDPSTGLCASASVNFASGSHSDLSYQLERFWAVDSVPTRNSDDSRWSMDDKRVIELWQKSIVYKNGHYELPIPFKREIPNLPLNISMAKDRLARLKTRLIRNPLLHEQYTKYMKDLILKEYAELVPLPENNENGLVWYIPHHPVFNINKPGRIRVVFDCSARQDGASLNENVSQGPDLTNKLVGVLLRFRQEPIAVSADVEAMFHQVKVTPEHRNVLRFLWWPEGDMTKEPLAYRMTVHLFGGSWSPSACSFALRRTAEDRLTLYPQDVVNTVLRNFYVDDCLKSVGTEGKATELIRELQELLSEGGFRLHKFVSNCPAVLSTLPAETHGQVSTDRMLMSEGNQERVLGIKWNVVSDHIGIAVTVKDKPFTRRGVLSIVSSIFDPLGYVSPFVLPAKRILQELCKRKLEWDEELPHDIRDSWVSWLADLRTLEGFSVPRSILPIHFAVDSTRYELHIFCDASYKGYGAACYVRLVSASGVIITRLLITKSRLAPVHQLTIPRLELSAAVMGVNLEQYVRAELDANISNSVFWTDSTVVLQYINSSDRRFQVFVANRISAIREASSPSQWRHIGTKCNPADYISRGMSAYQLIGNKLWLEGPDFLQKNECEWPAQPSSIERVPENDPEAKREQAIYLVKTTVEDVTVMHRLFSRYSAFHKLKKAVAWILRAKSFLLAIIRKLQLPDMKERLSHAEVSEAEREILKYVQIESFPSQYFGLKKPLKESDPLSQLEPQMVDGLMRIGGRLPNHQIILPKNHRVVELIITQFHEQSAHSGQEHVLSLIRQHYWIIGGRRVVKKLLRCCPRCRLKFSRPLGQRMADLPLERQTADEPPFACTGLDYFGPLMVKSGRNQLKRYGCLFTCFASRAVHIEVAHSLDTDSFLNAFQRFVSRRGIPRKLWSDNGTNFVGANKELQHAIRSLDNPRLHDFMICRNIDWKFNAPTASHMGGVWERLIRSVRKVLTAVVHEQMLTDETLLTFMCLAENVVNSRPLSAVSDDPRDVNPLTPNHLLQLRATQVIPFGVSNRKDMYVRRRWKQCQYLADVFWSRWRKEYLPTLQIRSKWLRHKRNLHVGDVVVLVDDQLPRNCWQLGRVLDTFTGPDGLVRSVKVLTRNATLVRPVHKLCLVESAILDNDPN